MLVIWSPLGFSFWLTSLRSSGRLVDPLDWAATQQAGVTLLWACGRGITLLAVPGAS